MRLFLYALTKKFLSKLKVPKASETSIDILSKKFMGKT